MLSTHIRNPYIHTLENIAKNIWMVVFCFYQCLLFTLRKITTPFFSVCNAYGTSLGFSNGVSLNSKTKRIASFFARQKNPERSDKKNTFLWHFFLFVHLRKEKCCPAPPLVFPNKIYLIMHYNILQQNQVLVFYSLLGTFWTLSKITT